MGARQKLNGSYFLGSLLTSGAVGCLMDSWVILVISLVILVVLNLHSGEIRLRKRRDR